MTEREPKKSEMIEVRISHESKEALHAKAKSEGRTVSDIVRSLISSYLSGAPSAARPAWQRRLGAGVSVVTRAPRLAAAAVAALAVTLLFSQSASLAEGVSLELDGTVVRGDQNIHSFGTEIVLAPDQPYTLPFGPESDPYTMTVVLDPVEGSGGQARVRFTFTHKTGDETVESPSVRLEFDQKARIEFLGGDGTFYGISARATPA